ncbi:MAG TPA: patatin-like phospholipase family protein [Bacilli bacterium]|nr:patatin-like phospholipase family protein [Bacilli bacterium]HPS18960.1 patatin-like phospholipase family protein [Bacilli bacterium]
MENRQVKKIGIVLSGGLARGAVQLAFAKQMVEKIGYERLKLLSASSIGSINAYSIACKSYDQMLSLYRKFDIESTKALNLYVRNRLFNKIFNGIESSEMVVPTYVTGTKLFGLETYYFYLNKMDRNSVRTTLNISMSFPMVNGPHRLHKRTLFIDGGATDNIPIYPMLHEDLDMVIILHCYPKYYPPIKLFSDKTIVIDVDVTLELDKSITSFSFSKDKLNDMADIGEAEGKRFAENIFSDYDWESIKSRCFAFTNSNIEKRKMKSGDGLMSFADVLNCLFNMKGYVR